MVAGYKESCISRAKLVLCGLNIDHTCLIFHVEVVLRAVVVTRVNLNVALLGQGWYQSYTLVSKICVPLN